MRDAPVTIEIEGQAPFALRLREDRTATLDRLLQSVPFDAVCERWGDEVYFSVPFHSELEREARAEMEVGEVAFWPDGDALAMFFGKTPSSTGEKPRAYSPCNIVGAIEGDVSGLRTVRSGTRVRVLRK